MKIYEDNNGCAVNAKTGASVDGHQYEITFSDKSCLVSFQNGPVSESGLNGIQNEHLLAIMVHRLKFLNEKFPCRENSIAITKIEEALMWLDARTKNRIQRGVEGKNEM